MPRRKFAATKLRFTGLCTSLRCSQSNATALSPLYASILPMYSPEPPKTISSQPLTHTAFAPPTSYTHPSAKTNNWSIHNQTSPIPYKNNPTTPSSPPINHPQTPFITSTHLNSTWSNPPHLYQKTFSQRTQCASATSPTGNPATTNAAPPSTSARTPKHTRV